MAGQDELGELLNRGVKFTQFLFPNGERRDQWIAGLGAEVEQMAKELQEAGWRFEIECHPRTQLVHADVCNEEGPLANTLVQNGPEVPAAIVAMIREAHEAWVKHGKVSATLFELKALLEEAEELKG